GAGSSASAGAVMPSKAPIIRAASAIVRVSFNMMDLPFDPPGRASGASAPFLDCSIRPGWALMVPFTAKWAIALWSYPRTVAGGQRHENQDDPRGSAGGRRDESPLPVARAGRERARTRSGASGGRRGG